MDDIIVYFKPYSILIPPEDADFDNYRFRFDGKIICGSEPCDWCSLPDILFEKESRKFIGLSFQLDDEKLEYIESFLNELASPLMVLVSNTNNIDRYQRFGRTSRLELYFESSEKEIDCIFASLYEGCWLFDFENGDEISSQPCGYWLSMVDDIRSEYGLN